MQEGVCHLAAPHCLEVKSGLLAALFHKCLVPVTEMLGIRTLAACAAFCC